MLKINMSGFQQQQKNYITYQRPGKDKVCADKHQNKTYISHRCWNYQSGIANNDQHDKCCKGRSGQQAKTDG